MSTVDADDSSKVDCDSEAWGVGSEERDEVRSRSNFVITCEAVVEGGSCAFDKGVDVGSSIGSSVSVSVMVTTIFSRSTGVRCFSRPRLITLSVAESFRHIVGRA